MMKNEIDIIRIVTIVGARPQFIKAAPVSRAIENGSRKDSYPTLEQILVHTGQHYDDNMSDVFFRELVLPRPDYNLGVGSGSHGEQTGEMLKKIEEVLVATRPHCVLVYGDTNSTLAGALAATKLHIPVAHVEAGLRSFNRLMPEEINRVLTDHVSSFLFCPSDSAVINLQKEGITERVYVVGDVMYDAFLFNNKLSEQRSTILADLGLKEKTYCLATVHRAENTDNSLRLADILTAFAEIATPECPLIVPIHPRTQRTIQQQQNKALLNSDVRLIPPVSYLDMIALETHAQAILTDSGGVQKEAYFAQVPCLTLRDETEWVETVEAGYNQLAGASTLAIIEAFHRARRPTSEMKPALYGKGQASEQIVNHLKEAFMGCESTQGDTAQVSGGIA